MSDAQPPSYATRNLLPDQQSPYAIASLAMSFVVVVWGFLSTTRAVLLPFDGYKQSRIDVFGGLLAVILAFASYRQPLRRRGLSHTAIIISALAFMLATAAGPLDG